ncbi:MAG TPA: tRNA (adenosine(37)-N6)-threonylcarbamoyltransferase complex ATPase subunit type 1 TsaE [Steroidobacteraceae bacterium]|nr:tRNA (adenosine(37)-N6)-threonylcarbamoyltransferase complex ATPase subunit type 1 TsaE [Steroidobacteraceae bacterium]
MKVATADDMRALGRALGDALRTAGGGALVIGIEGELGAGKTTLVGGILAGLGITGAIRSPTYTLIEPYEAAGLQLYHIDLYRLSSAREVEALGIRDLLDARAVLLIEWPSRGAGALPTEDLRVSIEYQGSGTQLRLLTAQGHSSTGDKLLEQILAAASE